MRRSRCAARRAAPSVGAWGDGYRNLLRLREHLRTLPRFAGASPNTSPDQGKPKTENRNGEQEEGFAGDRFGLENMQR